MCIDTCLSDNRLAGRRTRLSCLEPKSRQDKRGTGEQNAQDDAETPDGFRLQAVGSSCTCPVAQRNSASLHVIRRQALREDGHGFGICCSTGVAYNAAVEKAERSTDNDADDNESQKQSSVNASHDE